MADVLVKNLTADRLAVPEPLSVILGPPIFGQTPPGGGSALGYSKLVENVDTSAVNNSPAIQDLVARNKIALEWVKDVNLPTIDDVPPTENAVTRVTLTDDTAVTYIRVAGQYKVHLSMNFQLTGIVLAELFVGGVLQPTTAMVWPDYVEFTVDAATPLGISPAKLLVNGRQIGEFFLIVQPASGFLPNH